MNKTRQMINKRLPAGSFGRNVVTLMTGTTVAQAIPIAISPILTRLYSPSDFGLLALFVSLTSICGSVAKGTVRIAGTSMNKIEQWEFDDKQDYDADIEHANTKPSSVYGFGHSGYYRNVIDSLMGKANPISNGSEGRKSLFLLEQIYKDK